jgi:hypothetical protein
MCLWHTDNDGDFYIFIYFVLLLYKPWPISWHHSLLCVHEESYKYMRGMFNSLEATSEPNSFIHCSQFYTVSRENPIRSIDLMLQTIMISGNIM